MNSVIISSPRKGAGQEKRANAKCTTRKGGRSGEGGGSQSSLSLRVIETTGKQLARSCDLSKTQEGLNIMATDT